MSDEHAEYIEVKLERLDDAIARREVLAIKKEELRKSILTDEQKQEMENIELEFKPGMDAVNEEVNKLRDEINDEIVRYGSSVKSEHLQAVFNRGRVTFDNKGLQQLEKANPTVWEVVKNFMKVGDPYTTIRNVR